VEGNRTVCQGLIALLVTDLALGNAAVPARDANLTVRALHDHDGSRAFDEVACGGVPALRGADCGREGKRGDSGEDHLPHGVFSLESRPSRGPRRVARVRRIGLGGARPHGITSLDEPAGLDPELFRQFPS
jgi:hypothetical protein